MRKISAVFMAVVFFLAGCAASSNIHLVSREDGSGTRSAFESLSSLNDNLAADSEITNSTAVVISSVIQDRNSIGYISLGSLNDEVKPLSVDGITASIENIENNTYPLARDFWLVNPDRLSEEARDFESFILAAPGQKIVQEQGYVPVDCGSSWKPSALKGELIIGGSSSIAPLMEKLSEAYMQQNSGISVQVQQSESSTGINGSADGTYDIGMSSRSLTADEISQNLTGIVIARDGIVLIVNLKNPLKDVTKKEIVQIFSGKAGTWNEIQ